MNKMTMTKCINSKGISLVETLIYVSIFSMFIITIASFMNSLTSTRIHNQTVLEVNDQGAKVMNIITQTIRNAKQINSPTISNTAANLNLATYSSNTNPTVFSQNNGVIYIKEGSGPDIALTNNKVITDSLTFINLSRPDTADIIKISFTLTNGSTTATFNGSANLRK